MVDKWQETLDEAASVVDKRQKTLNEADTEDKFIQRIKMDGEELCALFNRRNGPASELVAEELRWRLAQAQEA